MQIKFFFFYLKNKNFFVQDDGKKIWLEKLNRKDTQINNLQKNISILENFLCNNSENDGLIKMQYIINEKQDKIENLEEIILEFEEFLKQNLISQNFVISMNKYWLEIVEFMSLKIGLKKIVTCELRKQE